MELYNHPVWEIYDQYRTTKLNIKYRSGRITFLKRWNKFFDISLAIIAPSSAIAAISFWTTKIGSIIWGILTTITALLASIRPFLGLTEKIQENEELLIAERSLEIDLYKIIVELKQKNKYNQFLQDKFSEALDKIKNIVQREREPCNISSKLKEQLCEEVNSELPTEFFFIPTEDEK